MTNSLVLGAGKIGIEVAQMPTETGDYAVSLTDKAGVPEGPISDGIAPAADDVNGGQDLRGTLAGRPGRRGQHTPVLP